MPHAGAARARGGRGAILKRHPPGHLTDADFTSDEDKWAMLRDAPHLDAKERPIRHVAGCLFDAASGDPRRHAILAMAFARDVIRYETDTDQFGGEDIAPAGELSDVIDRGADDCDAKARLFVALCLAVGLEAEMVPHWEPDQKRPSGRWLAHVSGKVAIDGAWVPVELTLARARLGEEPLNVPKETSGHWSLNEVPK